MVDIKDVYSQFKKKELLAIAKELEISVSPSNNTRVLAQAIIDDIDENGVPEVDDEASDALFEFLMVAEYIDEDGNLIEVEKSDEDEEVALEDIPDWICFGFMDSRDPACNKCKLVTACWDARVESRPECFGLLYNKNEPECQVCIEAPYCMKEMT